MESLSMQLQPFFEWLLRTTLQASLLICLILLFQVVLRSKLGARWHYCLWLLLLIRMAMPWAPQSRLSVFNLIPQSLPQRQTEYARQEVGDDSADSDVADKSTAKSTTVTTTGVAQDTSKAITVAPEIGKESQGRLKPVFSEVANILPLIWLTGALVLAVYVCTNNFNLLRIVKRERPLTDQKILDLLEDCKAEMGIRIILGIVTTDKVKSPALFGFIRPRLLLPKGMLETLSLKELRHVFLHELAHLKRHDIYIGWLMSLLQVLHWFNPLIWLAFYRLRADRELACDALVLARTQSGQAKDYGRTIVNLLERFSRSQRLPAMAGILETKAQLKRRITMITRFKKNSYQWSPLAVILIIILSCVSLPDAKRTKASETSAAKPPGMVVRQVWADAADPQFMGAPSPDGKYLSYVDWETGDLAVHELATGTNRLLTNEGRSKGLVGHSVFSPDSKQVAYHWWDYGKKGSELRIVGLDGSGPRALNQDKETANFPMGWTPDGAHILALSRMWDKSFKILLVPVADGPVRVLKTLGKKVRRRRCTLSPDGQYVAYSFLPSDDSPNTDISVVAVDGSHEIPLVKYPADDFVLGWAPDGKRVVFASNRTGSMGVWAIDIVDGKTQGTPQLLKPEIGQFYPLGLTQNGSFYYGVYSGGNNVYTAPFDPLKGNLNAKSVIAVHRYEGSNWAPDWSPDGRYLACVSVRPGASPVFLISSVETGEVRELSPDLKTFNVHSLRWAPDGRSLLGAGKTKDVFWGVLKIDVETGEVTPVVEGPGIFGPEWAADGKAVFYVCNLKTSGGIIRYDLATGENKELYSATGFISALALSPDGRQLAFRDIQGGALKVLPSTGGQPRDLVKVEGKITIAWTPDGCQLVYGHRGIGEGPGHLWRISADGGEAQKLDLEMPHLGHVRFHPDGQQITFMGATQKEKAEVWVMENFLPGAPVAKPDHQPHFRKIRIPTKPGNGVLSPDGKKLAFVSEGSIWVVPVHGKVSSDIAGEPVRLPGTEGAWRWGMSWSADGKWIAYNIKKNNKVDEIHVISSTGGEPKKIPVSANRGNHVLNYRLSLSPNGKVLAFTSKEKEGTNKPQEISIYTIPVDGGVAKRLTDPGTREPAFSPDGKKIAYVKLYRSKEGRWVKDIWVIPASGGTPVLFSDLPGRGRGPVWSPDGKMIAFNREPGEDNESNEIWIVPVSEDGKAAAAPTKIKLPLSTYDFLAGWTSDNKIGLNLQNPPHRAIYTVPASGGNAVQVTPAGWPCHPRWSPDGKRIFFRWDGIASVPSEGGEISIGPLDADSKISEALPGGGNAVSPDGEKIVFSGAKMVFRDNKKAYEVDIYTIPIEGGEPNKLTISPGQDRFPCWSPDGKKIAFIRYGYAEPWKEMSICIVSTEGGEVRQLTSESHRVLWSTIAWSPDGKSIAYFSDDKAIKVIPVQGGESRVVVKVEDVSGHSELAWSPDDSKLVYSSKGSIWMVSLDGGEPEEIRTGLDAKVGHLSWSPDGKKIAFTAIKGGDTELWLMENFLPTGVSQAK